MWLGVLHKLLCELSSQGLVLDASGVMATFCASAAVAFSLTTTASGPFVLGAVEGCTPRAALLSACLAFSNAHTLFVAKNVL